MKALKILLSFITLKYVIHCNEANIKGSILASYKEKVFSYNRTGPPCKSHEMGNIIIQLGLYKLNVLMFN